MTTTTSEQDHRRVWVYAMCPPCEEDAVVGDRQPLVSVHTSLDSLYREMRYDLWRVRLGAGYWKGEYANTDDVADDNLAEALEAEGDWAVTVTCRAVDVAQLAPSSEQEVQGSEYDYAEEADMVKDWACWAKEIDNL
jgi:hypothetical protein